MNSNAQTPGAAPPQPVPTPDTGSRAGGVFRTLGRMISEGRGSLFLVIVMIAAIWIFFQVANPNFLSATNITNLFLQNVAVATISIGVVLVLLLGEIDLSIGLFTGFMVTQFGIPSFVITLAGLLTWLGMQLLVLGETGTVNLSDNLVTDLTSTFFPPLVGWIIAVAAILAAGTLMLLARERRRRTDLPVGSLGVLLAKLAAITVVIVAAMLIFNQDRGLPLAVVILMALTLLFVYVTEQTRFWRHVFAVGGNAEAARRAGIRINRVRVIVFTLSSTLAATGGILAASRLLAVNQSSGGSDLLLSAIAGPVIAGTSLFGGRGSVWSALLGALVIGSITNGMNLLSVSSSVRYIVTGVVLMAAVTLEAATRPKGRAEA
jgi:D-xylose transport system permease protein